MRILVLQLARFGDIYQTWPALTALARKYPGAEISVLVRERFKDALEGLSCVQVIGLPTAHILEPAMKDGDEALAHTRLQKFLASLKKYDKVINLSFSPFSSYLTDIVAGDASEVRGYTRHADGYLNIPDDPSAYFYAQGEIGRFNRFHITDIFASVADVELCDEDFRALKDPPPKKNQVIVHLGASQAERIYPGELWVKVLSQAIPSSDCDWILIGSPDERKLASAVAAQVESARLINKAGETRLPELFHEIAASRLYIGCDSGPAQIASLVQTPVLQLTSDASNFWTTGPTSAGSRIIHQPQLDQIPPEQIAAEAVAMTGNQPPRSPCFVRASQIGIYEPHGLQSEDFGWNLIKALYTNSTYPECTDPTDLLAFQRLFELSELALQQLEHWNDKSQRQTTLQILDNVDRLLSEVGHLSRNVDPLIQWFQTERLRIPPQEQSATLARTKQLFADLKLICAVYNRYGSRDEESRRAIELCRKCAPALREFKLRAVQDDFQNLISTLHELARHSTKVGAQDWSAVLTSLNDAFERRDLIEVADQLEYVLVPALS